MRISFFTRVVLDYVLKTCFDVTLPFFRLDDEAKDLFVKLGSSHSKELAFRDNWVFVGGKNMKHPSAYEQVPITC